MNLKPNTTILSSRHLSTIYIHFMLLGISIVFRQINVGTKEIFLSDLSSINKANLRSRGKVLVYTVESDDGEKGHAKKSEFSIIEHKLNYI